MRKVIEIQTELVAARPHDFSDLRGEAWLPISGQPHHLVFVSVLRKPKQLGESSVENAERMWILYAPLYVDLVPPSDAPHGAAEVAKPVNRYNGRFLKRRSEKGTG